MRTFLAKLLCFTTIITSVNFTGISLENVLAAVANGATAATDTLKDVTDSFDVYNRIVDSRNPDKPTETYYKDISTSVSSDENVRNFTNTLVTQRNPYHNTSNSNGKLAGKITLPKDTSYVVNQANIRAFSQVKSGRWLTDTDYEAMAGTPTTENLFITYGGTQWIVDLSYRKIKTDYSRKYTFHVKDTENYRYYDTDNSVVDPNVNQSNPVDYQASIYVPNNLDPTRWAQNWAWSYFNNKSSSTGDLIDNEMVNDNKMDWKTDPENPSLKINQYSHYSQSKFQNVGGVPTEQEDYNDNPFAWAMNTFLTGSEVDARRKGSICWCELHKCYEDTNKPELYGEHMTQCAGTPHSFTGSALAARLSSGFSDPVYGPTANMGKLMVFKRAVLGQFNEITTHYENIDSNLFAQDNTTFNYAGIVTHGDDTTSFWKPSINSYMQVRRGTTATKENTKIKEPDRYGGEKALSDLFSVDIPNSSSDASDYQEKVNTFAFNKAVLDGYEKLKDRSSITGSIKAANPIKISSLTYSTSTLGEVYSGAPAVCELARDYYGQLLRFACLVGPMFTKEELLGGTISTTDTSMSEFNYTSGGLVAATHPDGLSSDKTDYVGQRFYNFLAYMLGEKTNSKGEKCVFTDEEVARYNKALFDYPDFSSFIAENLTLVMNLPLAYFPIGGDLDGPLNEDDLPEIETEISEGFKAPESDMATKGITVNNVAANPAYCFYLTTRIEVEIQPPQYFNEQRKHEATGGPNVYKDATYLTPNSMYTYQLNYLNNSTGTYGNRYYRRGDINGTVAYAPFLYNGVNNVSDGNDGVTVFADEAGDYVYFRHSFSIWSNYDTLPVDDNKTYFNDIKSMSAKDRVLVQNFKDLEWIDITSLSLYQMKSATNSGLAQILAEPVTGNKEIYTGIIRQLGYTFYNVNDSQNSSFEGIGDSKSLNYTSPISVDNLQKGDRLQNTMAVGSWSHEGGINTYKQMLKLYGSDKINGKVVYPQMAFNSADAPFLALDCYVNALTEGHSSLFYTRNSQAKLGDPYAFKLVSPPADEEGDNLYFEYDPMVQGGRSNSSFDGFVLQAYAHSLTFKEFGKSGSSTIQPTVSSYGNAVVVQGDYVGFNRYKDADGKYSGSNTVVLSKAANGLYNSNNIEFHSYQTATGSMFDSWNHRFATETEYNDAAKYDAGKYRLLKYNNQMLSGYLTDSTDINLAEFNGVCNYKLASLEAIAAYHLDMTKFARTSKNKEEPSLLDNDFFVHTYVGDLNTTHPHTTASIPETNCNYDPKEQTYRDSHHGMVAITKHEGHMNNFDLSKQANANDGNEVSAIDDGCVTTINIYSNCTPIRENADDSEFYTVTNYETPLLGYQGDKGKPCGTKTIDLFIGSSQYAKKNTQLGYTTTEKSNLYSRDTYVDSAKTDRYLSWDSLFDKLGGRSMEEKKAEDIYWLEEDESKQTVFNKAQARGVTYKDSATSRIEMIPYYADTGNGQKDPALSSKFYLAYPHNADLNVNRELTNGLYGTGTARITYGRATVFNDLPSELVSPHSDASQYSDTSAGTFDVYADYTGTSQFMDSGSTGYAWEDSGHIYKVTPNPIVLFNPVSTMTAMVSSNELTLPDGQNKGTVKTKSYLTAGYLQGAGVSKRDQRIADTSSLPTMNANASSSVLTFGEEGYTSWNKSDEKATYKVPKTSPHRDVVSTTMPKMEPYVVTPKSGVLQLPNGTWHVKVTLGGTAKWYNIKTDGSYEFKVEGNNLVAQKVISVQDRLNLWDKLLTAYRQRIGDGAAEDIVTQKGDRLELLGAGQNIALNTGDIFKIEIDATGAKTSDITVSVPNSCTRSYSVTSSKITITVTASKDCTLSDVKLNFVKDKSITLSDINVSYMKRTLITGTTGPVHTNSANINVTIDEGSKEVVNNFDNSVKALGFYAYTYSSIPSTTIYELESPHSVYPRDLRRYLYGFHDEFGNYFEYPSTKRATWTGPSGKGFEVMDGTPGCVVVSDGVCYLTSKSINTIQTEMSSGTIALEYYGKSVVPDMISFGSNELATYPFNLTDTLNDSITPEAKSYYFIFKVTSGVSGGAYSVQKSMNPDHKCDAENYADWDVKSYSTYTAVGEPDEDGNINPTPYGQVMTDAINLDDEFTIYWDNTLDLSNYADSNISDILQPSIRLGRGWVRESSDDPKNGKETAYVYIDKGTAIIQSIRQSNYPKSHNLNDTHKYCPYTFMRFKSGPDSYYYSSEITANPNLRNHGIDTSRWIKEKYVSFNMDMYMFTSGNGVSCATYPVSGSSYNPTTTAYDSSGNARKMVYIPKGRKVKLGSNYGNAPEDNNCCFSDYGFSGRNDDKFTTNDVNGVPYTYHFWCPLSNTETNEQLEVTYGVVAINDDATVSENIFDENTLHYSYEWDSRISPYGEKLYKLAYPSIDTNAERYTLNGGTMLQYNATDGKYVSSRVCDSYNRYTRSVRVANTSIMGRIGALTVVDSEDPRFQDTFKHGDYTYENLAIAPYVRAVTRYRNVLGFVNNGAVTATTDSYNAADSTKVKGTPAGEGTQYRYLLDPIDIRGRIHPGMKTYTGEEVNAGHKLFKIESFNSVNTADSYANSGYNQSVENNHYSTFGKQSMKKSQTIAAYPWSLYDLRRLNVHDELEDTSMKVGYTLYCSLETIGNYFGSTKKSDIGTNNDHSGVVNDNNDYGNTKVQVRPYYIFLPDDPSEDPMFVDVYMEMNGNYVPINLASADSSDLGATMGSSYMIADIDTSNSYTELMARRMVDDTEFNTTRHYSVDENRFGHSYAYEALFQRRISTSNAVEYNNGFEATNLPGFTEESLSTNYICGNSQLQFLRESNRTFIGGESSATKKEIKNLTINAEKYGQKWYFGLALPSNPVFVPAGKKPTPGNIIKESGDILMTIHAVAIGDTWVLEYDNTLEDDLNVTKTWTGGSWVPETDLPLIPVAYFRFDYDNPGNPGSGADYNTQGSH